MDWNWNTLSRFHPLLCNSQACLHLFFVSSISIALSSPLLGVIASTLLSLPFLQLSNQSKKNKLNIIITEYHYIRPATVCQHFSYYHVIITSRNWLLSQFSRLLDKHPTRFASWQLTFTTVLSRLYSLPDLILFPVHNQMTQNSPIFHLMLYFNLWVWTWIVSFRPILKAAEHDQGCVVKSFFMTRLHVPD